MNDSNHGFRRRSNAGYAIFSSEFFVKSYPEGFSAKSGTLGFSQT
jgi:hypothetical protein